MNDVSAAFPIRQLILRWRLPGWCGGEAAAYAYEGRMLRDDYILRLIRQLGEVMARIAGKRKDEEYEAAVDEAGKAWDDLLGHPRSLVDVVDTPTLAALLKERGRMHAAAQLLIEEGRAHVGNGDRDRARACFRRAGELFMYCDETHTPSAARPRRS